MTSIAVIQIPNEKFNIRLKDALGKERTGWSVYEDKQLGYPLESKEKAIQAAKGIIAIRCARNIVRFTVLDAQGITETIVL